MNACACKRQRVWFQHRREAMRPLTFCLVSMIASMLAVALLPQPVPIEQLTPASDRLPITQVVR